MIFKLFLILLWLATVLTVLSLTSIPPNKRVIAPLVITPLTAAIFWFVITLLSFNVEFIVITEMTVVNNTTYYHYGTVTANFDYSALLFFLLGMIMCIKTGWDALETFRSGGG